MTTLTDVHDTPDGALFVRNGFKFVRLDRNRYAWQLRRGSVVFTVRDYNTQSIWYHAEAKCDDGRSINSYHTKLGVEEAIEMCGSFDLIGPTRWIGFAEHHPHLQTRFE